jgi:hypothetical protein
MLSVAEYLPVHFSAGKSVWQHLQMILLHPIFVTDALAPFTVPLFLTFVLTAMASTVFYIWIYNHTLGSILIAILTHAASNAASDFVNQLAPADLSLNGDWGNVIVFGLWALTIVVFTRGRLGYNPRGENENR